MMGDWINKPVTFKKSDPIDQARYEFARKIPFTALVKDMIDSMMKQGSKSLSSSFHFEVSKIQSRDFTSREDDVVEVNTNQFF